MIRHPSIETLRILSTSTEFRRPGISSIVMSMQSWTCDGVLGRTGTSDAFALIILNQPVTRPDILRRLWQSAQVKICADGGGNRLHDTLRAFKGSLDGEDDSRRDVVSDLRDT